MALSDAAQALLDEKLFGTLATVSGGGVPAQVLVWYLRDGDEILIASQESTQKVKNIRRTGWASLSVSRGPLFLTVRGHPTLQTDPDTTRAEYRRIVERYLDPDAAEKWIANAEASAEGVAGRVILHLPSEHVLFPQRG